MAPARGAPGSPAGGNGSASGRSRGPGGGGHPGIGRGGSGPPGGAQGRNGPSGGAQGRNGPSGGAPAGLLRQLEGWPTGDQLRRVDRRFGLYLVTFAILNGLLSIGLKVGWDFSIFWQAARDVAAGHSAYTETLAVGADQWGNGLAGRTYVSPPFMAHLLAPISSLPEPVGLALWSVAGAGVLAGAVAAVGPSTAARLPHLLAGIGVLWIGLFLGQVNLFVLGGLLLALGARDDRLAGAGLALAVLLRGTPAVFGLVLLFDRRWRAVGWSLVFFAIGALVGGIGEWQTYAGIVRTLLGLAPVASIWQVSPAVIWPPLSVIAGLLALAVFAGAGRLGEDARLARATVLGLALLLAESTAWFHWLGFALAPLLLDGERALWSRRALLAFIVASLLPVPLGSWATLLVASITLLALAGKVAARWRPGVLRAEGVSPAA